MKSQSYTFKKKERLTGKKLIGELFGMGQSMLVYPVKAVYFDTEIITDSPAKAAFSVNKKNFRRAVDRNFLKRRMKEIYRLNKNDFYQNLGDKKLAVMFIYVAKEILPYSTIEKSIKTIINKLA